VNGKEHGHGTLQFATGEIYTGDFADGERSGRGTMVKKDGHEYTGQWVVTLSGSLSVVLQAFLLALLSPLSALTHHLSKRRLPMFDRPFLLFAREVNVTVVGRLS
jgi:hypothetical protein